MRICNISVSGSNQDLIMRKGGARLLANIGSRTDDPQTLRMVAGAIANLCGNGMSKSAIFTILYTVLMD